MENTNRLIGSTSPYLLQHANNPVDWYPWGEEALTRAKEENKPIILSIGYSSCHWCHVMAHESFEDDSVADFMNAHFVNIKLDREERPDIDHIYMDAVQAMGLQGGWPLNVFLTPDQKPFYGGTYFPKENWLKLLQSVTQAYKTNYEKLSESAEQFAQHLQNSEVAKYGLAEKISDLTDEDFIAPIEGVIPKFDTSWGGFQRAPKFPMPSVWHYLLHHSTQFSNELLKDHLFFTLDKIGQGGIYDQVGGGFSRYSVDAEWHVPHFEKMLYDNGQLMSLYANAYKIKPEKDYLQILKETATWLKREMTNADGGFYAALDADSEGVEGKYYVWSYNEIKDIAGDDFNIISKYYDVSREGNWEGSNVLRRLDEDESFSKNWKISQPELEEKIIDFKTKALGIRGKRIAPGLDNKIISGWNGLMLSGLSEAYQATYDPLFKSLADQNARFIQNHLLVKGKLIRTLGSDTQGFLEDYAAVIQGFIKYYETVFDEEALLQATTLADLVMTEFYDPEEKLFFYTSSASEDLIARKKELFDNVIPSSNAIMAENLNKLSLLMYREDFKQTALDMARQVSGLVKQDPEYMSYWSSVSLMMNHPTAEIIITEDQNGELAKSFHQHYLPNKTLMSGNASSKLPPLQNKTAKDNKPTIYVCFEKTCKKPVTTVEEALAQL